MKAIAASIDLIDQTLVVELLGADRLWALKSRLEIPPENVQGAAPAHEEASQWLHGLRLGGTHIPGVISAGHLYADGKLVFWDVHDAAKAIAIQLRDEHYDRLIIEVADPEQELARIDDAVAVALPT